MAIKLDWRYHRPGWNSCKYTQEFLAQNKIVDGEVQSAAKEPVEGKAVLALLEGMDELFVAQGKKVLHFDLKTERPADDELLGLLLGRSGKLRAPALRRGARLIVGYNQELLPTTLAWFVWCGGRWEQRWFGWWHLSGWAEHPPDGGNASDDRHCHPRANFLSGLKSFTDTLVEHKRPEPSYRGWAGREQCAWVYLVGSVAGTPLIKWGFNASPLRSSNGSPTIVRGRPPARGTQKKPRRGQPRSFLLTAYQ
jgi:arsenate reductase-like glutaredoxin family protein